MAKRFTDSEKWKKKWFRSLSPKFKCAWSYLCDNCDHAGFWSIDTELMSFQVGENITLADLKEVFADHIELLTDTKLFIREFVEFQYGELNPNNNAHRSVLNLIQKAGAKEPLMSPSRGAQDKDKDKDKDLDKDKGGSGGGTEMIEIIDNTSLTFRPKFDLESLYRKYPRKQGKAQGLKKLKAVIKSQEDYNLVSTAIDKFIAHHRQAKTESEFIPYFSSFMSQWTDWNDSETGAIVNFSATPTPEEWDDIVFGDSKAEANS